MGIFQIKKYRSERGGEEGTGHLLDAEEKGIHTQIDKHKKNYIFSSKYRYCNSIQIVKNKSENLLGSR